MAHVVIRALFGCRQSLVRSSGSTLSTYPLSSSSAHRSPTHKTIFTTAAESIKKPSKQYDEHIPTSPLQKIILGAGSAVRALIDPTDDGSIATLGEASGAHALINMRDRMKAHPVGREILADRPRIKTENLPMEQIRTAPPGTLGHAYNTFMEGQGLSADARAQVRFVDDEELAYVAQRYRDIHDFIHCLLDFPTISEEDEIAVKWFEAVQTGLPMCYLSGVFGPLRLKPSEQIKMYTKYMPWAIETGKNSTFLLNVYYEKHLDDNLDELRASLNIKPPPV